MEYLFFKEDTIEVGQECQGYCPSCKQDTPHSIVTRFEREIRSVQCVICNSTHAHRAPRGEVEDELPEPVATKRRENLEEKVPWEETLAKVQGEVEVRAYTPREGYEVDDLVDHPVFGEGYVEVLVTDTKLQAIFRDGPRVLAYNRPDFPEPAGQPNKKRPKFPRPTRVEQPVSDVVPDSKNGQRRGKSGASLAAKAAAAKQKVGTSGRSSASKKKAGPATVGGRQPKESKAKSQAPVNAKKKATKKKATKKKATKKKAAKKKATKKKATKKKAAKKKATKKKATKKKATKKKATKKKATKKKATKKKATKKKATKKKATKKKAAKKKAAKARHR